MKIRLLCGIALIALVAGLGLVGAHAFHPVQQKSTPPPDLMESVLYEHYFKSVAAQDPISIKAKTGLVDEEMSFLQSTAQQCLTDIARVDEKARPILEDFHAKAAKVKRMQDLPPPPAELATLQVERNSVALRYRDILRGKFGESKFAQLDKLARTVVKIEVIRSPNN